MRVLFDALSFGVRPSGTRTRLLGLAPALMNLGVDVGVLHGPGLSDEERSRLSRARLIEVPSPPRGPLGRWLRQTALLRRAAHQLHCDYTVVECFPWPRIDNLIGVVHDLRHVHGSSLKARVARRVVRAGLQHARQIHVVSDATGAELFQTFGAQETRVVPNGVDGSFFTPEPRPNDDAVLAGHGLKSGYLLVVGHLERRKATDVALSVREELARRGLDVPLVFVGKGDLLPEEGMARLKGAYPGQDIGTVLRDVPPEDLPSFYRLAGCVLAPAREEGFGMTPLEAIACGAPVVASRIAAHQEVLGGAVRYATVDDVTGFTSAVLDAIEGRANAVDAVGPAHAAAWSWERAAERFLRSLEG